MKVYGIFSGEYSDWNVHGYFIDKSLAEKYCALKNRSLDEYSSCFDNYYVYELNNIQDDVKGLEDIELKYYHEIVIDYNRDKNGIIRNEPDRYKYYIGEIKKGKIRTYLNGWISFSINSNTTDRERVEKIALDLFNEFKWLIEEFNGNELLAIKFLGNKKGYEVDVRR